MLTSEAQLCTIRFSTAGCGGKSWHGKEIVALRIDPVCHRVWARAAASPLLPVGEGFLCWPRLRGAVAHCRQFLLVTGLAGRKCRQPPRMQEPS